MSRIYRKRDFFDGCEIQEGKSKLWSLAPGEAFQAPEAALTYLDCGLGKMSRSFHDFYREHLIRSPYQYKKRPVQKGDVFFIESGTFMRLERIF